MQLYFFVLKTFKNILGKFSILSKIWKWPKQQWVGESCSLRHYDIMRTKTDLWFTVEASMLYARLTNVHITKFIMMYFDVIMAHFNLGVNSVFVNGKFFLKWNVNYFCLTYVLHNKVCLCGVAANCCRNCFLRYFENNSP